MNGERNDSNPFSRFDPFESHSKFRKVLEAGAPSMNDHRLNSALPAGSAFVPGPGIRASSRKPVVSSRMYIQPARRGWTIPIPFLLLDALLIAIGIGMAFDNDLEMCSLVPLPFLLYSKMGQERLLDNFIRRKIFGHIMANPGENYTSIMLSLELPNGTFLHHLNRLEHENLIKSRSDGRQKRYYPANVMLPEPKEHILTNGQQVVYGLIEDDPGISQNEMAKILRVSAVAVNYHLEALLEKGVVRRDRIGMRFHYFPTNNGHYGEGELEPLITPPV